MIKKKDPTSKNKQQETTMTTTTHHEDKHGSFQARFKQKHRLGYNSSAKTNMPPEK